MPELPEVETVRRGLAPVLVGRRLKRVEQRRPDLRFPLPKDFAARLEGRRIEELSRRAKYLLARLDSGELWTMHLGMSGRFTIIAGRKMQQPGELYDAQPPDPTHTHVIVETDKGVRIEYNDPRRFGYMDLIPVDELSAHPWFAGMGPEPLGNEFHALHLRDAFAGKKQSVKATLLDQRIVAGLGNIYVCEALFRAGINPKRAAGRISPPRLERLTQEIRDVLTEAIDAGGSSLRDYAQADGALGYFQHRFKIYDREGRECGVCKSTVKRIVQAGRSTFFCSRCQK